ncbi:unnamed protein product [Symbiodinium pilosum]|uniref:DUF3604 domain-containing protein n=1 Tax=Symbiodinium pilosum TaxID=2952 RepID=A0A812VRU7_SYMPI|nr:unnamed protein product [Symbiodinium pilosum]
MHRFIVTLVMLGFSCATHAAEWRADAHARTGLPVKVVRDIPALDNPELISRVQQLAQAIEHTPTNATNVTARMDILRDYHNALQNSGYLLNYRIAAELNQAEAMAIAGSLKSNSHLIRILDQRFRELSKAQQLRNATGRVILKSPRQPVLVAKTYTTVRFNYVVETPLEAGARIRLGQNWYSDLGRIQFTRPLDANFATVTSNRDDVEFVTSSRIWFGGSFTGLSGGNRPMIAVKQGRLERGDVITLTIGETRDGSPGWLIQSFTSDAMDLRIESDFNGDGIFVPVAQPRFRVIGKDASQIRVVAPSVVRPGEPMTVRASVEDAYFNRASRDLPGRTELWYEGERIATTQSERGDPATFIFKDISVPINEEKAAWLEVRSADNRLAGISNPIVARRNSPRLYWGELHGHEGYTDANGTPEWYMNYAKDVAFLDFASLTGHDIMLSEVHFRHNYLVTDEYNLPDDGFVTFRAYEWTNNWRYGGHHNVFLLDDKQQAITVMQAPQIRDMVRLHREYNGSDKVLIIPHAHQPGDWDVAGADLVEIFSQHGSFEWFGREYLQKGHRVGINAASDDHLGHPGNAPSRGRTRGGLGAVFADQLTRKDVFSNLKARHTYGTSFARIYLETQVAGASMGDTVNTTGETLVSGFTAGTNELADITLIVNGEETQQHRFDEAMDNSNRLRFRLTLDSSPGENPNAPRTPRRDMRYWGRLFVHKIGEEIGTSRGSKASTQISSVQPLGIEPYADRIEQAGNHEATFTFRLRGDHDGALIDLANLNDSDVITLRVLSSPLYETEHWNIQELPRLPGEYFNIDVPDQEILLEETMTIASLRQKVWTREFDERASADLTLVGPKLPKQQAFEFKLTEDDGLRPGEDNYVYVRVRQLDDETAWSSPTFIQCLERHVHEPGSFYTAISFGNDRIDLLYTAPTTALNSGPHISVQAASTLVANRFSLRNNGLPCTGRVVDSVDYDAIDAWQFEMSFNCTGQIEDVDIDYAPLVDEAWHTNHVELQIGTQVSFDQFDRKQTSIMVPVGQILWLHNWTLPDKPAELSGKAPSISDYFFLGFDHVLTGWDHLAFLLGLLVVVSRLRSLLLLITSFTIAHSITLAISALDIFTLNVRLIEVSIALTIVYIGVENLIQLWRKAEPSILRRWLTTLIFGLIHGFGFSFLLREIGLPDEEFLPALLLFNIGVEAAQITVVAVPFVIAKHFLHRLPQWQWIACVLSFGVLLAGSWWLIERLLP